MKSSLSPPLQTLKPSFPPHALLPTHLQGVDQAQHPNPHLGSEPTWPLLLGALRPPTLLLLQPRSILHDSGTFPEESHNYPCFGRGARGAFMFHLRALPHLLPSSLPSPLLPSAHPFPLPAPLSPMCGTATPTSSGTAGLLPLLLHPPLHSAPAPAPQPLAQACQPGFHLQVS